MNREFKVSRPNALWVSDLNNVATWRGFAYTALVIDARARRIVGWRVSCTPTSPSMASNSPCMSVVRPVKGSSITATGASLRYTGRLAQMGISPSVGSVGDPYDNALAESESIIGLYKTELIARRGPWRHCEVVKLATLEWVHWYNHRRLFEPLGHVPPAGFEYTIPINCKSRRWLPDSSKSPSGIPGAVQLRHADYASRRENERSKCFEQRT